MKDDEISYGRTREEWKALYRSYGWDEATINASVARSFGDAPGDVIRLWSMAAADEYERVMALSREEISDADRRAAYDRLIDYTSYPEDSPYRRRREREEAERAARGEGETPPA